MTSNLLPDGRRVHEIAPPERTKIINFFVHHLKIRLSHSKKYFCQSEIFETRISGQHPILTGQFMKFRISFL